MLEPDALGHLDCLDHDAQESRLAICVVTMRVIARALALLGIGAP